MRERNVPKKSNQSIIFEQKEAKNAYAKRRE
jgi:hypothetical protein